MDLHLVSGFIFIIYNVVRTKQENKIVKLLLGFHATSTHGERIERNFVIFYLFFFGLICNFLLFSKATIVV